jgi:hypothetical protein
MWLVKIWTPGVQRKRGEITPMRKPTQNEKLYVTISEVLKRYGICRETFDKLDLPVVRFGPRSLRVPVAALEHMESARCIR